MMKNRKKYDMCKILLLEDDISLIDGLEFSLQKNDFTVETVRTVGEALKRLQNDDLISQYDLLLLDITLPDGTGFEVCERVRKENSRIPVIFLTASDEEVNVIRGLDGGGDDYHQTVQTRRTLLPDPRAAQARRIQQADRERCPAGKRAGQRPPAEY